MIGPHQGDREASEIGGARLSCRSDFARLAHGRDQEVIRRPAQADRVRSGDLAYSTANFLRS
jgi:hypothetical protein